MTALYRHFDAEGRLLYVGVTANPELRLAAHRTVSPWAPQIARVAIEWLQSRREALTAERKAIRDEQPAYNRRADAPSPSLSGWRERLVAALGGKSARTVSIAAGLGPNYLQQVLRDGKEPTIDRFLAICAAIPADPVAVLGIEARRRAQFGGFWNE